MTRGPVQIPLAEAKWYALMRVRPKKNYWIFCKPREASRHSIKSEAIFLTYPDTPGGEILRTRSRAPTGRATGRTWSQRVSWGGQRVWGKAGDDPRLLVGPGACVVALYEGGATFFQGMGTTSILGTRRECLFHGFKMFP